MRLLTILFIIIFFSGCNKIEELFPQLGKENTSAENIVTGETEADHFTCMYPVEPDILDYEKWQQYLRDNLELDNVSLDTIPAGRYLVVTQFVINKNGDITDVLIIEDPGYGLGKRVKEVISRYKNQPIPSQMIMEANRSYRKQPVTFIVEEDGT